MSRPIPHAAHARRRFRKVAADHPSHHSHDSQKPPSRPRDAAHQSAEDTRRRPRTPQPRSCRQPSVASFP